MNTSTEPVFQCEHCDKSYARKYSLMAHRLTHKRTATFSTILSSGILPRPIATNINVEINKASSNVAKAAEPKKISTFAIESNEIENEPTEDYFLFNTCFNPVQKSLKKLETEMKIVPILQCHLCTIPPFTTLKLLKDHVKSHETKEPVRFQCNVCPKNYVSRTGLYIHKFEHTGLHPHHCTMCDRKFAMKSLLKRHVQTHLSDEDKDHFICDFCQKLFFTRDGLIIHMQKHIMGRNFVCSLCGSAFYNRKGLTLHTTKVHGEVSEYTCDFCQKKYRNNKHILKVHIYKNHLNFKFPCSYCDVEFSSPYMLRLHKKSHKFPEKFKNSGRCPVCNKAFKEIHLPIHIKRHYQPSYLKFSCDFCKRKFQAKILLKNHIHRIHLGLKRYQCKICKKGFVSSVHLRSHIKVHDRVRPWHFSQPRYCMEHDRTFHDAVSHFYHMITYHKNERLPCHVNKCTKTFANLKTLEDHLLYVHKQQVVLSTPYTMKPFDPMFDQMA